MAKNSVRDFDATAANNTDIQSVDIAENCAPSGINNAIRELMADIKDVSAGTVALESPQADSLTVTGDLTVDTNTLFVDSTNNRVGIGTSSPSAALDIAYGDYQNSGAIKIGADLGQNTSRTDASRKFGAITAAHFDNDEADLGLITMDSSSTSVSALTIGGGSSSFNSASTISFQTSSDGASVGTERMRIDSSGNVGVGTTSPDAKMSIEQSGTGNFDSIILSRTTGNVGEAQNIVWQQNDLSNLKAASISGVVTGADAGALTINTATGGSLAESMRIDSSGNVGIGTTTITSSAGWTPRMVLAETNGSPALILKGDNSQEGSVGASNGLYIDCFGSTTGANNNIIFRNTPTNSNFSAVERMRIDTSGNLLVGKTSTAFNTQGSYITSGGILGVTRAGGESGSFNRTGSDGTIMGFYRDGSNVGSIGVLSTNNPYFGGSVSGHAGLVMDGTSIVPLSALTRTDNAIDLGDASFRFDDIYATNTSIQTSDANEKQQIASLTDAEITAAKAISKLFKTFKWNDSVEAKGDNARKHTGHISQEVQQAMTDAGLDASDYAFWCSNTWWETQTDVPAVEAVEAQDAVYDDDGNLVSEAVEAVEARDAYTRTDIYDTAEEAPEGATERTRLGIRYPELLAFVGAATEQRLADIETRLTTLENS